MRDIKESRKGFYECIYRKSKRKELRECNVGLLLNETMEKTDDFLAVDMGQSKSW